jgi:hypothetical protein
VVAEVDDGFVCNFVMSKVEDGFVSQIFYLVLVLIWDYFYFF